MTDDLSNQPAAPDSALAGLRARREAAVQQLHKDLPVPRLDPPVFVRFRVVDQADIDEANKLMAKSKDRDRRVITNAIVLAKACLGIFEKDAHGEPVGDPDEWLRFDKSLAAVLEVDLIKGSDIVRALYLADGDIIATCEKLWEFSGFTGDQLESEFAGN